jgi:hypothetical protein
MCDNGMLLNKPASGGSANFTVDDCNAPVDFTQT